MTQSVPQQEEHGGRDINGSVGNNKQDVARDLHERSDNQMLVLGENQTLPGGQLPGYCTMPHVQAQQNKAPHLTVACAQAC